MANNNSGVVFVGDEPRRRGLGFAGWLIIAIAVIALVFLFVPGLLSGLGSVTGFFGGILSGILDLLSLIVRIILFPFTFIIDLLGG